MPNIAVHLCHSAPLHYLQGKLATVDTILALLGYVDAVNGYVCWQEGVPGKATFRAMVGVIIGGWGALGLAAGR